VKILSNIDEQYIQPVQIRPGWDKAGRRGVTIGKSVVVGGTFWTPVTWDGEDDPDWFKTAGLEVIKT
jgi:hypothetical protein